MGEEKKISMSLLENTAEQMWNKNYNYINSLLDKVYLDMAKQKNHIIAFLILSRAVYDNISIRQVLCRYMIEEMPIEAPFTTTFKDLKNHSLKFEIESQLRLVKRNKRIRISDADFETFKTSMLQELSEAFNGKQVKDEQESTNSQENPQTSAESVAKSQS